jgi:phosphatidylinositol dimannoside acyltransferase
MNLVDLASSPRLLDLGMSLSGRVGPATARRLTGVLVQLIGRIEPRVYRVVRANLRGVWAGIDPPGLEAMTRRVFSHFVLSYYDLFRAIRRPDENLLDKVRLPQWVLDRLQEAAAIGRGVVLVMPHTASFDLGGQVVQTYVPHLQVISLPQPSPGFAWLNELRQRGGAEITPLSPAALRQAFRTLRTGGVLVVGGDRPVSDLDEPVSFFGRPVRMPSAHIRLALKTDALVAVICCVLEAGTGHYALHTEPFLEMVRSGDREQDLVLNMRRVLDSLESVIRRWSDQWLMTVPLWPDLLET